MNPLIVFFSQSLFAELLAGNKPDDDRHVFVLDEHESQPRPAAADYVARQRTKRRIPAGQKR